MNKGQYSKCTHSHGITQYTDKSQYSKYNYSHGNTFKYMERSQYSTYTHPLGKICKYTDKDIREGRAEIRGNVGEVASSIYLASVLGSGYPLKSKFSKTTNREGN